MNDIVKLIFVVAFIMIGGSLVIWHKGTVWKECRQTNSFLYCFQLINR